MLRSLPIRVMKQKKGAVMVKCLKITISGDFSDGFLREVVQTHARKLTLEGTAQLMPEGVVRILVCGGKEEVDNFLDAIHKASGTHGIETVEVEPFMKDRDFRGVFRVIE